MNILKSTLVAAAALTVSATAAQAVTIVQYRQTGNLPSVQLVNTAGGNYTLSTINYGSGGAPMRITLFDPMTNATTSVDGTFIFSATGNSAAQSFGTNVFQDFNSGSFSLTAQMPFTFTGFTGTNILSASFTGGQLSGQTRGLTSAFQVSIPVDNITGYTSDFFSNPPYQLTNFALSMSDANRGLSVTGTGANARVRNYTASSTGTFGATVVPEPATWAMMIVGFGLVGASLRRRPTVARVAA